MPSPDDPRYEWIEVTTSSDSEPQWVRGACNHLTPDPVYAQPTGELVAWLCPDCDAQLPAEWRSEPAGRQQVWADRGEEVYLPLKREREGR